MLDSMAQYYVGLGIGFVSGFLTAIATYAILRLRRP
jgi:hypothetical protein